MFGRVLAITGDGTEARQLRRACDALGVELEAADSIDAAMSYLQSGSAGLLIGDFDTIRQMRLLRPGLPLVVLTDATDSRSAIDSIKHGVLDVLTRPLTDTQLRQRLHKALKLAEESAELAPTPTPRGAKRPASQGNRGVRLVGQSPAMQEVYRQIGLLAPQPINVLITGESGTGKELVAKAIVEHSDRADKPFIAINCAAIPETLLESELFGHEKGAFTGADRRRIGRFEQCDGGTLFLDEVGDMPLLTQGKLLRVLQDHTFQRVGGDATLRSDVRILAATHQPLEAMIAAKRFRQDLFYRLQVATIHVPALREREVDAVLLAHYFMDRIGRQMNSQVRAFAPDAVAALLAYPWPGNVRELENVIRASLAMARGEVFRRDLLPPHIRSGQSSPRDTGDAAVTDDMALRSATPPPALAAWIGAALRQEGATGDASGWGRVIGQVERALIHEALVTTSGRLQQAATLLGISRTTLRKKMAEHGITVAAGPVETSP